VSARKAGRIDCGGLMSCRRTFDAEKNQGYTWIICGRCWRLLPADLRHEHKRYNAMHRKMERARLRSPDRAVSINNALFRIERLQAINGDAIREFFRAPAKPAGLDNVLEELGLA
jgi:hypothetical protein